jgi:hypothetical protein
MKALDHHIRSPRLATDLPARLMTGAGVVIAVLSLACLATTFVPVSASAAVVSTPSSASVPGTAASEKEGSSLEAAAAKAGSTGRTIAMSLIGLALAVAAIVLAFKRDFKEAAGVFVVGIVAVLLATPTGVKLLQDTVSSLFGSH